jgi:hypothetical protein
MQKYFICVLKENLKLVCGYGFTRQEARKDAYRWVKEYYGSDHYDPEWESERPNLNTDLLMFEASKELYDYISGPKGESHYSNEDVPLEIINGKAVLSKQEKFDQLSNAIGKILDKAQEDILSLITKEKG